MPATPIEWSKRTPNLQTKVNSSSLGPFKQCPRRYYYEIVKGLRWGGVKADLRFGELVHEGREDYARERAEGADHEEGVRKALRKAQEKTWLHGKPEDFGGGMEKSRLMMLRTIVEYLDHWESVEGYETWRLASGKPAIELQFEFDSGVEVEGESIRLVGKLDEITRVGALGGLYVLDCKTTKMALGNIYTSQYTPNNQFSLYALAARICYSENVKGVLLDAISVKGGEMEFSRLPVERSEQYLDEWLQGTHKWLRQMGECAKESHWPQNDMSCGMFGGCPWREVCGARPKEREFMLRGLTPRSQNADV